MHLMSSTFLYLKLKGKFFHIKDSLMMIFRKMKYHLLKIGVCKICYTFGHSHYFNVF